MNTRTTTANTAMPHSTTGRRPKLSDSGPSTALPITARGIDRCGFRASAPRLAALSNPTKPSTASTIP